MSRVWLAGILAAGALTMWAQDDPPSRVARLNFLEGSVSLQSSGNDDWTAAAPNYPLTIGDHLWADEGSRAELHIGSTAIRLDSHTALAFLNLDDRMTQVRLSDGTLNITIRRMADDESYEIDTPNSAVTLLRPGAYRIDADPDRQITTVTVRGGEAEITAAGTAFPVHPRQTAYVNGTDQPDTQVNAAGAPDDFDRWWQDRDQSFARRPPPRYVSPDMVGYEDLDDHGDWRDSPGYGTVWYPRVEVGWAPYHNGHWAWVEPWGWTWVDDAPWGFAPFHYGRWAFVGSAWGWIPGPINVRPVYAPALVAWVGGEHWGAGIAFGGGAGVAWFPLGPREVYVPSYRVSNTYVTRVNVTNVTNINVTNITNVTNVRYVNQNVPGAMTAVSRQDFAASRPVARVAVRVPPSAVAAATVSTREMPVTRQQAVAARPMNNVPVARPPQAVVNARVITRTPPPAATVTLARPVAAQPYRQVTPNPPASANRPPVQQAPSYRPPAQQTESYKPPPQQQTPAYKPPAQQNESYRPPPQQAPPNRQPEREQSYRPPAGEPPQHTHGGPPPSMQTRPNAERPRPEPKPREREKEKEKK